MIIGALLAGGIALTGCTPSEEPSPVPPAPGTPPPANALGEQSRPDEGGQAHAVAYEQHTSTDQQFAQQVLSNREQLLELGGMATKNAEKPEVKQLATTLRQDQQPEIDEIKAWLRSTESKQSDSAPEDAASAETDEAGTLSPPELRQLGQTLGAEFDRQWVAAVLALQQGASELANTELEEGSAQRMRDLAEKIVDGQPGKIDQARTLQV